MLLFGDHLISVDEKSCLKIWESRNGGNSTTPLTLVHAFCVATELYGEIQFNVDSFRVTVVMHPSTYLNKILLGSQQGTLQLWNIRTRYVSVCILYTTKYWQE